MTETFLDPQRVAALIEWGIDATHLNGGTGVALGALRFAAVAAARLADPQLLPLMIEANGIAREWGDDGPNGYAIERALTELIAQRAGLEPAIVELAKHPWPDVREAVAAGLPEHEPACRALLFELAADRAPEVRRRARSGLRAYAERLPWWTGLVSQDPTETLDAESLAALRKLDTTLRGHVSTACREALGRLPAPVAIDVLRGLLAAAAPTPIGYANIITTLLELDGGLPALMTDLAALSGEARSAWQTWSRGALKGVRRAGARLEVIAALVTLPEPASADAHVGVADVMLAWLADDAATSRDRAEAFALLERSAPADDDAVQRRASICRTLIDQDAPLPLGVAKRVAAALSAGDEAALARLGGVEMAHDLMEKAPSSVRGPYVLARLEQTEGEARLKMLLDLLDPDATRRPPIAVARLKVMLDALLEQAPTDLGLWHRTLKHRLPAARRELLAGALDAERSAHVLLALGARYGGPRFVRRDSKTPPGGSLGPTAEEWAVYRAQRSASVAAAPLEGYVRWALTPALPPLGELTDEDWAFMDGAVSFLLAPTEAKVPELVRATIVEVMREEASPRAAAVLARLGVGPDE